MELPPREAVADDNKIRPGLLYEDTVRTYTRVERDRNVRLTPVWVRCVEPLTTGTALLLCGCVFETLRQPGMAPCIVSYVFLTYAIGARRAVTDLVEHVIQQHIQIRYINSDLFTLGIGGPTGSSMGIGGCCSGTKESR